MSRSRPARDGYDEDDSYDGYSEDEGYTESDDYGEDVDDRDDSHADDGYEPPRRRRRSRRGVATAGDRGIGPGQAAQAASRQLAELTGKNPEGATAVSPGDEGWAVCIEVVEDRRIPSSADVMAVYEAQVSMEGELLSYRRASRYARGRGDGGGGS